ncbi:MAG TPA: O-antigen ligase family protein [Gallionella sp.]|nr:O-antigen ligase family protein [Gallionella sp.]
MPPMLQGIALPRIATLMIGMAVPVSVALDNLLLAVVLLGVLFNARDIWRIAKQHPVARAAWLLFGALLLAMFYGSTPLREAAGALGKYADLAFVPLFMLMLPDDSYRRRAQHAFIASMGLTLLLSYLVGLKLLPVQHWMSEFATADNPVIFHSHITQNNMMAFAVFLALLNLREAAARSAQLAWGLFAALASCNALFMVQGRTGYMILLVLLGWFAWTTLARRMHARGKAMGWRHGAAGLLAVSAVALASYFASPRLHDRVSLVAAEYQAWQPNQGKDTSTGQRLDFYYNSLQIIAKHPLLGVGTGGFAAAYAEQTKRTEVLQTPNPHNEYLLIAAQAGVAGLALLLYLFYSIWRSAPLLDTPFAQDAPRGLVLAYMVNGAFNSALHDHSDGLFFAFMMAVLFADLKMKKSG